MLAVETGYEANESRSTVPPPTASVMTTEWLVNHRGQMLHPLLHFHN